MRRSSLLLLLISLSGIAFSKPFELFNSKIKVVYDSRKLSFYNLSSSKLFMKDVSIGITTEKSAVLKQVQSSIFGPGSELNILDESGDRFVVSLYDSLPFVLIQKIIKNSTSTELKVSKMALLEGQVSLGVNAAGLKTISTAGLKQALDPSGGYVFMAVGDPVTNNGVVCAWLTSNRGSGIVSSESLQNQVILKAHIDYGDLRIPAGQVVESETLAVGYGTDVRTELEAYADAIARNMNIKLPPQPTIYCTWYHGGASDEKKIALNTEFASERLKQYGLSVMQIDDHWQSGLGINGPKRNFTEANPSGPYPSGMKKTADYIHSKGMTPGIWYIPFAGSWYDDYWKDKMDLFLKEGSSTNNYFPNITLANKPVFVKGEAPYDASWGGTCLDLTNPKAQAYVSFMAKRLSKEWGYKYFKMDGLWTGTGTRIQYVNNEYRDDDLGMQTRFNPAMTPIEAYAKGLEIIRDAAGPDVFLLGCAQTQNLRSFGPSLGRLNAMRVGPDNSPTPQGLILGPKYASRVYFLNKRVWYNDPDPGYPRKSVPLEMSQTLLSWISLSGSLHGSSEQYAELPPDRLDLLRKTMLSHNLKTVRPVDYLENDPPRIWHLTDDHGQVRKDVIGLFNFDVKAPANVSCSLARVDLPKASRYIGFDFWANKFIPPFSESVSAFLIPGACRIVSIRPESLYPQVVSTSRHVTQGVVDLTEEKWDKGTQQLSATSEVLAEDPYEIRVVVPASNKSWLVQNIVVSEPDVKTSFSQEGSCIRVTLSGAKDEKVKWQIRFKNGSVVNSDLADLAINAAIDLDQIVVKWSDNNPYQYRLFKNGVLQGEFSSSMFIDRDVKLGGRYTYGIQAKDWNGHWGKIGETTVVMPAIFQTPALPPLPQIYCADLKSVSGNIKIAQPYPGTPITSERNISATPGMEVRYNIPAQSKRFVTTVTLERTESNESSSKCVYVIMGDVLEMGEPPVELKRSPALAPGEKWNFDLNLDPRYKQILLTGKPAGTSDKLLVNVIWTNAGFLK